MTNFIDTIEKFLVEQKIYHTRSGQAIGIRRGMADVILFEDKCDIKENFSQQDKIDLESHFIKSIPTKGLDIITLEKTKDSKNLTIISSMSLFKDKSVIGESKSIINIKDILISPSTNNQKFTINCKCGHQKDLSCKGIRE